jgi:hypothetical protein
MKLVYSNFAEDVQPVGQQLKLKGCHNQQMHPLFRCVSFRSFKATLCTAIPAFNGLHLLSVHLLSSFRAGMFTCIPALHRAVVRAFATAATFHSLGPSLFKAFVAANLPLKCLLHSVSRQCYLKRNKPRRVPTLTAEDSCIVSKLCIFAVH